MLYYAEQAFYAAIANRRGNVSTAVLHCTGAGKEIVSKIWTLTVDLHAYIRLMLTILHILHLNAKMQNMKNNP